MLTCLLKRQIHFSSFRDFLCLLCISLSCLNLLRLRVTHPALQDMGQYFTTSRASGGICPFSLQSFLLSFPISMTTFDNVPSVMQFSITCWKSMEKKKGNFSVGPDVRLFRARMKIWLASSCWQKKGKFLCEESCPKSVQYGLWLQVVCLCLVLSFTPA